MTANAPTNDDADAGTIDSDEETEQVMAAIARSRPRPLAEPMQMPIRKHYANLHLQSIFRSALSQAISNNWTDKDPNSSQMEGIEVEVPPQDHHGMVNGMGMPNGMTTQLAPAPLGRNAMGRPTGKGVTVAQMQARKSSLSQQVTM